jgi:hypothetical protein
MNRVASEFLSISVTRETGRTFLCGNLERQEEAPDGVRSRKIRHRGGNKKQQLMCRIQSILAKCGDSR